MSSPVAIHHIAFRCRDIAAQEAFYTKHFGFKRCRTFRKGEPGEFFMLKLGSVRLEFFPPEKAVEPEPKGGKTASGYMHLAFEVPRLETILDSVRADGIRPDDIIELPKMGPGFRIVFFSDPEGNIIELLENCHDEV